MNNIVITIGREYGSGGRYIGQEVAKRLNIDFYDNEIIQKTYEINDCNYSKLKQYDESKKSILSKATISFNNTEELFEYEKYQLLVADTIKQLADSKSCVIIGRNANNILKNRNNVINIFIYSKNKEFKLNRKMNLNNISHDEAEIKMKQIDKQRKNYYESLNKGNNWGDKKDYDFCIDSGILGIEKTIDLIVEIYKQYALNN